VFRISIGHKSLNEHYSVLIFRDYVRENNLKLESNIEYIKFNDIIEYIKKEDKIQETDKFRLVYEGVIIKDLEREFYIPLFQQEAFFFFRLKENEKERGSSCCDSDITTKGTNVYVIGKRECFYIRCEITDTFKILQNKISRKYKKNESKYLLYRKEDKYSKYIKYSLKDDDIIKEDELSKKQWDDGIVLRLVDKDHPFELEISPISENCLHFSNVFTINVICSETVGSLKNKIQLYFRVPIIFSENSVELKNWVFYL
jgi:hypothetical protein